MNIKKWKLIFIAGKIYALTFLKRLMDHIQDIGLIPESQNGFMPGRSTIDQCFSLRLMQEKCILHSQGLYLLFIELTRSSILRAEQVSGHQLENIGCPEHFFRMIRSFHDDMKVTVREGNQRAEIFVVINGIKQGCVFAGTFFSNWV